MSSAPAPTILGPGDRSTSPTRPRIQRLLSDRSYSASTSCLQDSVPRHTGPRSYNSLPSLDAFAELIGSLTFDDYLHKHLGNRDSMLSSYINTSKHRMQHGEEQLPNKDNASGNVRERAQRDSPIIAELKTNVIIKDEFTLVRDLSLHLAARYARPDSSIMVQVDHSACLALGGNFDPCYILTLTTGPAQMGPNTNKRNAALIQSFMADILSVPPERGVVKFQPIPEENFAYNGTTLLGEIERREKQYNKEHDFRRAGTHTSKKSVSSLKKSASKPDEDLRMDEPLMADVKSAELKDPEPMYAEPKTLTAMRPKTAGITTEPKRMSTILSPGIPATVPSVEPVYELPAASPGKQRDSSGQRSTSSGSNGLRMNPVSSDPDPKPKSSPARPRPVTSSGIAQTKEKRNSNSHMHTRSASQKALPQPPSMQPHSNIPSPKQDKLHAFLKTEYTTGHRHTRSTNANRISAPMPIREKPMRMLGVRDSYVDSLMGKPHIVKGGATEPTIVEKPTKDLFGREPTANTAKRRSTMLNATPKIPERERPVTRDGFGFDAKSVKSTKNGGKRKSLLNVFKRTPVPA